MRVLFIKSCATCPLRKPSKRYGDASRCGHPDMPAHGGQLTVKDGYLGPDVGEMALGGWGKIHSSCPLLEHEQDLTPTDTVDDFVDAYWTDEYASFFLLLKRLPAVLQNKFCNLIQPYKLFCVYEKKRYRVTGGSRMGDIWLTSNMKQEHGYEKRVNISDCKNFTKELH